MSTVQLQGYHTLIELCVAESKRPELHLYVDRMRSSGENPDPAETLGNFAGHLDENARLNGEVGQGIHFIMGLDWKADIRDLHWRIRSALKDNFDTAFELPSVESYPGNASVGRTNVFLDFDRAIRQHGFQIGFIDTQSDEYVILVFKQSDALQVRDAVYLIGFEYMDMENHGGKLDHVLA